MTPVPGAVDGPNNPFPLPPCPPLNIPRSNRINSISN
jgi:hypothetical protein